MPARSSRVREQPAARMRPLARLVGTWLTQGVMLSSSGEAESALTFVDRYAWLPGGHFLAHTITGELGGSALQGLEVIGYDGKVLRATSYDSQGLVSHYTARLRGKSWTMLGERERFAGRFDRSGRQLEGRWERRAARGLWRPMMDIVLTRVGD